MAGSASLTNYRQSPRKVRLVADLVRGKSAPVALSILSTLPKRAALPLEKLIRSAIANAKGDKMGTGLYISSIEVNKGMVMKRFMPRARGSAAPIRKKSSHITLTLKSKEGSVPVKSKKVAKTAKKAEPATPTNA